MADTQEADSTARRTGLMIVGGGTLLGFVLITMAAERRADFEAWVREDVDFRLRLVLTAMTLLMAGPLLGFAGYLWYLGRWIVATERFPPPGVRVVRDTPIVLGQAASRRGRFVQGLAGFVGLVGLLFTVLMWRLASLFDRGTP